VAVKSKDALKAFRELLAVRQANAKLSDADLAKAVGVSKGLISQIKSGTTPPSRKLVPTLAWILHETPETLYDDLCLFLDHAGLEQPCETLATLAGAAKESAWIVMPRYAEVDAAAFDEALRRPLTDSHISIRVFTTQSEARELRAPIAKRQAGNRFKIKTPNETLLNIEYPMLFLDPEVPHSVRVFRGVPALPALQFAPTRESPWSAFLLRNLVAESQFLNIPEMAEVEREQDDHSLVILYTDFFPEEDKKGLVYETVKHNLQRGVRYLYIVDESEYAAAKITHGLLRNQLRREGVDAPDRVFKLHKVASTQLFRDGTFILYATPDAEGPQPNHLLRQVLGSAPIRFQRADKAALTRFYTTFMTPVMANTEVKTWLDEQDPTK